MNQLGTALPFFSPNLTGNFAFRAANLERLWFRRTFHVSNLMHKSNYYNVFCKQFDRNEHFSPLELSSAALKIGVWINSAGLGSALIRIRFGSWNVRRLNRTLVTKRCSFQQRQWISADWPMLKAEIAVKGSIPFGIGGPIWKIRSCLRFWLLASSLGVRSC